MCARQQMKSATSWGKKDNRKLFSIFSPLFFWLFTNFGLTKNIIIIWFELWIWRTSLSSTSYFIYTIFIIFFVPTTATQHIIDVCYIYMKINFREWMIWASRLMVKQEYLQIVAELAVFIPELSTRSGRYEIFIKCETLAAKWWAGEDWIWLRVFEHFWLLKNVRNVAQLFAIGKLLSAWLELGRFFAYQMKRRAKNCFQYLKYFPRYVDSFFFSSSPAEKLRNYYSSSLH